MIQSTNSLRQVYHINYSFAYYQQDLSHMRLHFFKCKDLQLTRRETQYLACFILGLTAKQIAKLLFFPLRTTRSYISFIKSKFDCKYRYQVVTKSLLDGFPVCEFLPINCKE